MLKINNTIVKASVITIMASLVPFCNAIAQNYDDDEPTHWAISLGGGNIKQHNNSPSDQSFNLGNDKGFHFFVNGDYFLTNKIALTGGLYFQQNGLLTELSNGIGLKKVNRMGVAVGAKAYVFPKKWAIQPNIGVNVRTNFLNLATTKAKENFNLDDVIANTSVETAYDIQCPFLTVNPKIGIDIRFISTVSLFVDYNLYYDLGGHNTTNVKYTSGWQTGQSAIHSIGKLNTGFNIGLRLDLPTESVSSSGRDNLLEMLFYLFAPNAY